MVIDGAAEELPVIERLLEELKTAQVKHLERRCANLSDTCNRLIKENESMRRRLAAIRQDIIAHPMSEAVKQTILAADEERERRDG